MHGNMSFSSLHWDILISSFKTIEWPSSNYPPWKTFEVRNCEDIENTLKIKVIGKSILFYKYLPNESSDLHEILYGGQLLSCELKFQNSWRSVLKCAWVVNTRARDKTCARAFTTSVHALLHGSSWNFNLSSQESNWPAKKNS